MAQNDFRSSHIPLSIAQYGPNVEIIPNRAIALYNKEGEPLERHLTNFTKYVITEKEEYSAPTLSFMTYGTHQYWWILCLFNGIHDPTTQLHAGLEVKLPKQVQIETYLNQESARNLTQRRFRRI